MRALHALNRDAVEIYDEDDGSGIPVDQLAIELRTVATIDKRRTSPSNDSRPGLAIVKRIQLRYGEVAFEDSAPGEAQIAAIRPLIHDSDHDEQREPPDNAQTARCVPDRSPYRSHRSEPMRKPHYFRNSG